MRHLNLFFTAPARRADDSELGRFISEDPARDGINWYGYCGANPMMFTDPWGLLPDQKKPVKGTINLVQDYDDNDVNVDSDPENEFHKGYDYTSETKEVFATTDGEIIYCGESPLYEENKEEDFTKQGLGNMIIIDYGNGDLGVYGHIDLDTINDLEVGDEVEQGDKLGKYKKIGHSYGAHLHYQTVHMVDNKEPSEQDYKQIELAGYSDFKGQWKWPGRNYRVQKANFVEEEE